MRPRTSLPTDLDVDLEGLSAAAEPWLSMLPVTDQRVQAIPDTRTLRYYQSTGLLDRPLRYDGRVARYGRRHLLQTLAIRVLQSQGLSLAQTQTALAGATNAELSLAIESAFGGAVVTPPPVAHKPVALTATEIAPGVVVTIDSRIHSDPTRVIDLMRRAIQGELP